MPIDEWAPPGGAIAQTIFGPGVKSNWGPGDPRYPWRSGFRYLVQPSERAKHVLGASAPLPYVCLTKQQAREYAVSWWRSLVQESKWEMCQHLFGDVNPYRLNALTAQELSFELIVFMISPEMENNIPGEGFVPASILHVQENAEQAEVAVSSSSDSESSADHS